MKWIMWKSAEDIKWEDRQTNKEFILSTGEKNFCEDEEGQMRKLEIIKKLNCINSVLSVWFLSVFDVSFYHIFSNIVLIL